MAWRVNYAELIKKYPHKRGVEVGVLRGDNAATLLERLPGLEKLYCVDHWANPEFMINYIDKVKRYRPRFKTMCMESVEASTFFENESLDFVFIDANHVYRNVISDIVCWVPKIKKGGIISGHDYVDYVKERTPNPPAYDVKGAVDKLFPKAANQGQVWWLVKGEGRVWEEWTSA